MADDEKKPRTVRMTDKVYDKLVHEYGSLPAAIASLLKPREEKPAELSPPVDSSVDKPAIVMTPKRGGSTPATWPYPSQVRRWEELLFPVGDIVASGHMTTWPVNPTLHRKIEAAFAPWREVGFVLVWGPKEREACTCVNSRLQPYFPGDRAVWCEFPGKITDETVEFMKTHTQVLIPMQPDLDRLISDSLYESLFNVYHLYYKAYLLRGVPYSLD